MRSSNAAASSACLPLREWPARPIFASSTSGSVVEVVHRPRRRPGPSRQARPVVLGIDLDPRVRVVAVAVVRIGGVVDRTRCSRAARPCRSRDGCARGWSGRRGTDPCRRGSPARPAASRADRVRTRAALREPSRRLRAGSRSPSRAGCPAPAASCRRSSARRRREAQLFCRAHSAGVVTGTSRGRPRAAERIRQIRHRRHRVEVRRQLAGAAHPVLPRPVERVDAPVGRRAAGAAASAAARRACGGASPRTTGRAHRPRQCQDDAEPRKPRTSEHVEWEFTTVAHWVPWRNPSCQPNKSRISPLSFAASGLTRMRIRE